MASNSGVAARAMTSLREKMGNIEVNAENIMTILKFAMEVVEATELKGENIWKEKLKKSYFCCFGKP